MVLGSVAGMSKPSQHPLCAIPNDAHHLCCTAVTALWKRYAYGTTSSQHSNCCPPLVGVNPLCALPNDAHHLCCTQSRLPDCQLPFCRLPCGREVCMCAHTLQRIHNIQIAHTTVLSPIPPSLPPPSLVGKELTKIVPHTQW